MADKIAVIGAGLIGRAWSISFARAGFDVDMTDKFPAALKKSLVTLKSGIEDLAANDLLQGQTVNEVFERITPQEDVAAALDGATYIQENTLEVLEVKKEVYAELDEMAEPGAVIGSSTSGFTASLFTEELKNRHRCLVAHPINPPYLVPAVELCPAPWTDAQSMTKARDVMKRAGHTPIIMTKEIDAFVVNRLQVALLHEAFRLVDGGYASCADVDHAIKDGLALRWSFMGPFETIDLNAPGGIRDYCTRFGDLFERVGKSQTENSDFRGELLDEMESQRRQELSATGLGERTAWRDRRLMALAVHKQQAAEKIGN